MASIASDRRALLRRIAGVVAVTGVSGLALSRLPELVSANNTVPLSGTATFDGPVGVGTASPLGVLDVEAGSRTDATSSIVNNHTLANTGVLSSVVQQWAIGFNDASSANRLSGQLLRFVYTRNAGTTGIPTFFDSLITLVPVINENLPGGLLSLDVEGPIVASGKTLGNWYGIYVFGPSGSGAVANKYALVTASGAGNVGIGTTSPSQMLTVAGDVGQSVVSANGMVKAAALVNGNASIIRGFNNLPGGSGPSVSQPLGPGTYEVNFGVNVAQRFFSATLLSSNSTDPGGTIEGQVLVSTTDGNANAVFVRTNDSTGISTNRSFYLMIF